MESWAAQDAVQRRRGARVNQFLSLYGKYKRYLIWGERFAGAMLIAVGVAVFFDLLQELSVYLVWFNRFAW